MKVLLIAHGKGTVSYGLVEIYYYLQMNGYDVDIINLSNRSLEDIKYTPDYVGITSMTKEFNSSIRIANSVRIKWHNCKIIFGGRHFSDDSFTIEDQWINHVDHIVVGEGEYAIEKIINGETKDKIVHGDMLTGDDYKRIPLPDKNMISNNMKVVYRGGCSRALLSRGCPYKCFFCESGIKRKKVISKDPDVAVRHIKDLVSWFGNKDIFIYDDVFTTYKGWLRDFSKEWRKQNVKANLRCFIHGKKFDDEIIDLLLSVNTKLVSLGAESGDNNVLKEINKKVTVEDYWKVNEIIKRKAPKLQFQCLWMLGNITETNETIKKTVELSKKIGNTNPWYSYAIPFPGTKFWKDADKYGKIINWNYDKWINTTLIFVPNGTTEAEMRSWRKVVSGR